MDKKEYTLRILMFPWLAHGHISPYLELAKKLSQRNFFIYFCSTPINLSSTEKQLDEKYLSSIQFFELHLPSLPELPPRYHTTKSIPSHLMSTLKKAFDMAEPSFANLLRNLKPDLLIYDYIQSWAPAAASRENIPAIHLAPNGAAAFSFCNYLCTGQNNEKYPFTCPYTHGHEYNKIVQMFNTDSNGERFVQSVEASCSIILIKTFREIEAKYIDYLSCRLGKELLPVGPLIQEPTLREDQNQYSEFVSWLNQKEKSSVVFASFGSEYFMTKEEIEEIANGLEVSRVSFIWVIRFPEGEDIGLNEVLPQGFLEKIGNRGMVVKNWAPQAKILGHSSVGGFVSHCGWSSVLEGIYYGVPIIAMPLHLDQPANAKLVVELGVGKEVNTHEGMFVSEEIEKVISEVVLEKGCEEIRKKAKEVSEKMKRKGDEDIDVVVQKLVQISEKSKKSQRPIFRDGLVR